MTTKTLTTKPHYPILDGLRGVAAILVVIYHLFEAYYPLPANHPEHHGYLAVDFFFMLSGFVIGYAYDDRWNKMKVTEFFKRRLIRLHPLVVLGVLIGAIAFWFDPYTNGRQHTSIPMLIGVMLIGMTLLPSPDIRGWGETHPLDGPCWSLLQEYIANILYALILRKMQKTILWILVVLSAIALTITAAWHKDLATGWGYSTFWIAMVRMLFPFTTGLLLFRTGKLLRIKHAFIFCSLFLALLFFIPTYEFNGIYEAGCIIICFPIIVSAGAGGEINGRWLKLCNFSGAISYPIYILHYPFIYIYTAWVAVKHPQPKEIIPVACFLFVFFIALAYTALKFYDEPIRNWLNRKSSIKGKQHELHAPQINKISV